MAATVALREVLNKGISSGNFVDTKIILYSHKDSSGRVRRPKALYANSHVLKTVPYFNDLLFGNFTESQSRGFNEAIDKDESTEDYGYSSDSDLEDNEEVGMSAEGGSGIQPPSPLGASDIAAEDYEERVEKGKVVKIPDIAFMTFQAFLMYLYTSEIEFAPFGSRKNRISRSLEIIDLRNHKVPRPSPKSIYRLADKYDVPALKTLALNHIRNQLTQCDIVKESFGRFASRYDEVRTLYLAQLVFVWMEDLTTDVTGLAVDQKIDSFAEGGLEHATEILIALLETANKDDDIKSPATASPIQATSIPNPAHWASVKAAIIKSIRQGVFFDRVYWARDSKAGDLLKPVYSSSTIMDDKVQQMKKMVKYFKGRNIPVDDLGRDEIVESDCEGDLQETGNEPPEEERTRALLTVGSFSAWKSLFFYRCTDTILFAPLKSQGTDSRSDYIRQNTIATAPPPCSPKSIYVLANLLEIQPLCNTAIVDIKSKVTLSNVVDEIFSRITTSQGEIIEMQWDLLIPNLKDPERFAFVKENIGLISSGSSPRCAGTLKLGLKKVIELKKKKREPPGVKLRCSNPNCPSYTNHLLYSSVAQVNHYCQQYWGGPWHYYDYQCVGCGRNRSGNYPSCEGCGKKFI